jgi:mitochondrial fission protein ELM1
MIASEAVATDTEDHWPFYRDNPDVVTLGVRDGFSPSGKPPVRIFLGTEEAQYRAERIFFWSIEKVRDPSRVYEIHLMKNVSGFNRRGWRTGFTNYRFAIPEFAGGVGRAIYNDVDQIYLADPALLFDLDMNGHGYLAISPKDTSVMLIDCPRMLPMWNRGAASTGGKHQLTNKPAETPGLWGPLDGHWNARDTEYREGLTKCLHYTALHQQPWHPFPGDYSYHPNPLAYIWYALEREADEARYQVFTKEVPSPDFLRRLHSNRPPIPPVAALISDPAHHFLAKNNRASRLAVSIAGTDLGVGGHQLDLAKTPRQWPDGPYDAVVMGHVFEHLPAADIAWLLDEASVRARHAVVVQVTATAAAGLGSPDWWRMRLDEAAARHPQLSWYLECRPGPSAPGGSFSVQRVADTTAPRVWALLDADPEHRAPVLSLARALGWPYESKTLGFNELGRLPAVTLGASLRSLDTRRSSDLQPPWPDLVIASGARSVPVARWLRQQSGGRTRLVHLGRPGAPFTLFDLIVTTPESRLPVRPNVLHLAAPLLSDEPDDEPPTDMASFPRPWTLLLAGGDISRYVLRAREAIALGKAVRDRAGQSGTVFLLRGPRAKPAAVDQLRQILGSALQELDPALWTQYERRRALLNAADDLILTPGDPQLLAEACLTGHPVSLFGLPKWYDGWIGVKPVLQVLSLLSGGGVTYRGTPHQQHFLSRFLDEMTTKGLFARPTDLALLHRSLISRGLVTPLGQRDEVATPKPLDDLHLVVERVRRLMTEAPGPISAPNG